MILDQLVVDGVMMFQGPSCRASVVEWALLSGSRNASTCLSQRNRSVQSHGHHNINFPLQIKHYWKIGKMYAKTRILIIELVNFDSRRRFGRFSDLQQELCLHTECMVAMSFDLLKLGFPKKILETSLDMFTNETSSKLQLPWESLRGK